MIHKDHFSLRTIGIAIALSAMAGCAAPAEEQEPANAQAGEQAAPQDQTGEVSSAMWGGPIAPVAPLGFGACGAGFAGPVGIGFGAVPTVGFAGPVGLGWGAGLGWGGWGGAGLGWGCGGGFAPAIDFRGDDAATDEGAAKE